MPKAYASRRPGSQSTAQISATSNQRDLFSDQLPEPKQYVELDLELELLAAIKQSLRLARQRGLSVDRVADRMSDLLPADKKVTARQLHAWCAMSREYHRFPAALLPAFCTAVECDAALRVLANAIDLDLFDAREQVATRLGHTLAERARLGRELRELQRRLGQ
jgi:hypothetical protein